MGLNTGLIYKGAGTIYDSHLVMKPGPNDIVIMKSPVPYYGYRVRGPFGNNKVAIYTVPYQPVFSDFIGGCGKKEEKIVPHSKEFERSAIEVVEIIDLPYDHKVYITRYKATKKESSVSDVISLLEYMIGENWNFPWDKGSITDISNGYVSDVADLYRSEEFCDQFGTIYSVLYSSYVYDRILFMLLMDEVGLGYDKRDIPFAVLRYLKKVGVDPVKDWRSSYNWLDYRDLIFHVLMEAKNCAHLEDPKKGNRAKQLYKKEYSKQITKYYKGMYVMRWSRLENGMEAVNGSVQI